MHACYQKAAGNPSDEQLGVINALALAEMTADDVYVRTAFLAHNGIDRDKEAFDDTLLESFTNSLPGKGLFNKHPMSFDGDSGPGIGRWFSARVVSMSPDEARTALKEPKLQFPPSTETAKLLEASFYIPRSNKNVDLIADIDAGIAGDVSIGFRAADRTAITDGTSDDVVAYRLLGPGEAYEGSLVWLGAQPGARVHKGATRADDLTQEDEMSAKDLEKANDRIKSLETESKDLKPKAKQFDAIEAACGEEAVKSPEAMARAIQDGNDYRKEVVDDIVAAERLAGMVEGDDEKAVEAAKAQYKGWSLAKLIAWQGKLKSVAPKGESQIDGGDPNATGAEEGGKDTKKTDEKGVPTLLNNPAICSVKAA